jgi:hypothetical protein
VVDKPNEQGTYHYEQFQFDKKQKRYSTLVKFIFPVESMFSLPLAGNIAPKFSIKHFLPSRRDEREEEDVRGFGFPSTLAFSRGGALALEGAPPSLPPSLLAPRQRTHQISSAPLLHFTSIY